MKWGFYALYVNLKTTIGKVINGNMNVKNVVNAPHCLVELQCMGLDYHINIGL